MKCTNCGTEFSGKFCPHCGTPAFSNESVPVQNEQAQPTEPVMNVPEQNQIPEPVQYNPSDNFNGSFQETSAQPEQTSFGQQFTNSSNGGYTGQQFTNQPQNNAPTNKKSMSTGKIVALVLGIVGGILLILCIIIGVAACNFVNAGRDIVNSIVSEVEDSTLSDWIKNEIQSEDYTLPEWLENEIKAEENSDDSESEDDSMFLDNESYCYYKFTDDGVKITGYAEQFENWQDTYTVKIPSKIEGEDVVEIEYMDINNYAGNDDLYIKVVIPGSVKVIREYAFANSDDISEVVIEDGVETIESNAFYNCEDLEKATVAKSVTEMDDCRLGLEYDDDTYEDVAIDGFVLYGAKGSTAESYAKENNLKFAEAK